MTKSVLEISGLNAWYGESHALHGIDLSVATGEVITLVGRNGAGKSTTMKSIVGLMRRATGSISLFGNEVLGQSSHLIAGAGVGFCPEHRGVFGKLTVQENLAILPKVSKLAMSDRELHELFPNLAERRKALAGQLSGGEQQMLAIARILKAGFPLLLLDEPTEGLAPVIVKLIARAIEQLKGRGFTLILVEQNLRFALRLSDRHYVLEEGHLVEVLTRAEAAADVRRIQKHLTA